MAPRINVIPAASRPVVRCALVAAMAVGLAAGGVRGAVRNWIDPTDGFFFDSSNWDSGIPGSQDVASFRVEGAYTVFFNATPTNERLVVGEGDVTFNLWNRTYTLDETITVGPTTLRSAALTVQSGTLRAFGGTTLGGGVFSSGAVRVTPTGNFRPDDLVLGVLGQGGITVDDGGFMHSRVTMLGTGDNGIVRGHGTVVLDGPGAEWNAASVYVGGTNVAPVGSGQIDIDGGMMNAGSVLRLWPGGTVNLSGGGILTRGLVNDGAFNWTAGTLTLRNTGIEIDAIGPLGATPTIGAGMELDVDETTTIGLTGDAELTVRDGGLVRVDFADRAILGDSGGVHGSVVVTGSGALFFAHTSVGGREGGSGGSGTLTLADRGVGGGGLTVAAAPGSTGSVSIDAGGGPTFWTAGSSPVIVGQAGAGSLTLTNDARITSQNGTIGQESGSSGVVIIDGEYSSWDVNAEPGNPDPFRIGHGGEATLHISGDGDLHSNPYIDAVVGGLASSIGTVTVEGLGSSWVLGNLPDNFRNMTLGAEGRGELAILEGGRVRDREAVLAAAATSSGSAVVDGAGSTWVNSNLLVLGIDGAASLAVTNGGDVSATGLYVATGIGSGDLVVDGGSLRIIDGEVGMPELIIGGDGTATIRAANGGIVSGGWAFIGDGPGTGTAVIENPGSALVLEQELVMGFSGSGALTVRDGASASSSIGQLAVLPGSNGQVDVEGAGSVWTIADALVVGGAINPGGDGTITVSSGGSVDVANDVTVHPTGRLRLDGGALAAALIRSEGVIAGTGVISGDLLNAGRIEPGLPVGRLDVDGALTEDDEGTLAIDLGGTLPGIDFDAVLVTGAFVADGELEVVLVDGFEPQPGDSFAIIRAASVDGVFDVIDAPPDLEVIYLADAVVLRMPDDCPTDLDGDGMTGFSDLLAVLAAWGPCPDCPEDLDGSGVVGFEDLLMVLAAWGECP